MSREVQVTFDCGDPAALGEFWAAALGYRVDDPPEGFPSWEAALEAWGVPEGQRNSAYGVHDPDGAGPRLFFQQVPEGTPTEVTTPKAPEEQGPPGRACSSRSSRRRADGRAGG